MTNLDSILKSRDITLPTNVCLVKAIVFPVVVYGCESWTYKESWVLRNLCFWTVVLEKALESPLDCKKIQPVHPKGDQTWILIEGLMLKLKLQYFGHLMHRGDSFERLWCWERLRAGGEGDDRGRDGWMASPPRLTWVWVDSRNWWCTGRPGMLQPMGSQGVGHYWVTEPNWISQLFSTLNILKIHLCFFFWILKIIEYLSSHIIKFINYLARYRCIHRCIVIDID